MAFKVGEDIEAWCTKCRTDTLHVVVALRPDGSLPQRVECKECHGQHMYHAPRQNPKRPPEPKAPTVHNRTAAARSPAPPKPPKPAKLAAPPRVTARVTAKAAKAAVSAATGAREWQRRMDELAMRRDLVVRNYSMRETFAAGDPVEHPKFGKGVVVEIVEAHKVAILFEDGRKVLAMGA